MIDALNYFAANPGLVGGTIIVIALLLIGSAILRGILVVHANERFAAWKCVNCGYDLRGSEDRCPECGFPIQPPELPLTMPLDVKLMREHWPSTHTPPRKPEPEETEVEVYSADIASVKMLVEHLRAEGAAARIRYSHFKPNLAFYSGEREQEFATARVWSADLDRAIDMIRHFSREKRPALEAHTSEKQ
jgi:hypothetical protein